MNTQTISKANLKKIYDVACSSWQTKLEGYAKRNPFDTELELTETEIEEMFAASDENQRKVLSKYFKRDNGIMDRVTSYETACEVLGLKPLSVYSDTDSIDIIGLKKLKVIIKALNQGWVPNFNNSNEYKYWCYFYMNNGVFSLSSVNCNDSFMPVSSALYYKNNELAQYGAKIALKEYKQFYLGE